MGNMIKIFQDVVNMFGDFSDKLYSKVFGIGGGAVFIILLLNFGSHWLFNMFGSASGLSFQKSAIEEKFKNSKGKKK